jgi:hypothetical protein
MTMFGGRRWLDPAMLVAGGLALSACSTPDYSGVQGFADAVTSMSDSDAALTTAAQQARLSEWVKQSAKQDPRTLTVNFSKCAADPATYIAQDCTVSVGGQPAPADTPDLAFTSLVKYASQLVAVADDTTCTALQTDATALGADLQDMAAIAKAPALATASGELTSIVSQAGCFLIARKQLSILRTATQAATPILAKLVPLIQDREKQMYGIIQDDDRDQIADAQLDYATTGSAADLAEIALLTASLDKAQLAPAYMTVAQIASLHQTLTDDLQASTVDLSAVLATARTLIEKAQAANAAASGLGAAAVRSHDARAARDKAKPAKPVTRRKDEAPKPAAHTPHAA